jgi:hypothetical protein
MVQDPKREEWSAYFRWMKPENHVRQPEHSRCAWSRLPNVLNPTLYKARAVRAPMAISFAPVYYVTREKQARCYFYVNKGKGMFDPKLWTEAELTEYLRQELQVDVQLGANATCSVTKIDFNRASSCYT